MTSHAPTGFKGEWRAAVSGFVFAGLVGAWMRYAMTTDNWAGLEFMHVRHAHSHVMLFVWATSGWMILLSEALVRRGVPDAGLRRIIRASLGFGFLNFLPFLFWGYKFAEIGPFKLPLSIAASTVVMFVWYVFAGAWVRHRKVVENLSARGLLDVAVGSMVLCTIGAWLRGMLMPLGVTDLMWTTGVVHGFLSTLTDGWLLVGLLGLLILQHDLTLPKWPKRVIIGALPFAFLVNVVAAPMEVRLVGSVSVIVLMMPLIRIVKTLAHKQSRFFVFALGAAIVARLLYSVPLVMSFADQMSFRIGYLHWLFLAIVTVGLWEASGNRRMSSAMAWTSVPLVLGILPVTGAWGYVTQAANAMFGVGAIELTHVAQVFTILTSLGPPIVAWYWMAKTRRSKCH